MKIMVSVDDNWGIGNDGGLLLRIPADMRYFKQLTTGHAIIMGRKTFESLPGGRPLPDRANIVLSGTLARDRRDIWVCPSVEALLEHIHKYNSDDIYVIGGGEIYRLLLPYCDTAYVTRIHGTFAADTVFPDLESDPDWELTEQGEIQHYQDTDFRFDIFKRVRT